MHRSPIRTFVVSFIVALMFIITGCGAGNSAPTAATSAPTSVAEATTVAEPTSAPESEPTSVPEQEPTSAPEASKPTKAPIQTNATPGNACVGTFGYGITCLSDEGWKSFTQEDNSIKSDLISAMAICPDKSILALTSSGVSMYDGSAWKQLPEREALSGENIACGPDNQIWEAHFQGVSQFVDGAWKTFSSKELATGTAANDLVKDVAIAADGTVWVVTANSIASYDGKTWTVYQEGQGWDKQLFFDAIALDDKGQPWAGHSGGLLHFDGKEWTAFDSSDLFTIESMAVDPAGKVWVGTFSSGAFVFDGKNWENYTIKTSKLSSNHVRDIAFDGQGRAWLGTEWGLSVFDGANWQNYHMHTADLVGNNIYGVVVTDGGPKLPAPIEKESGSLTGIVEREGAGPIANTAVEVCVESLGFSYNGDTPCSDQPLVRSTKTDDKGAFTLTDLPVGNYVLTVQSGDGKWAQLTGDFGLNKDVPVKPGEETKLNTLTVKKDNA